MRKKTPIKAANLVRLPEVRELIRRALQEDIGTGDVTTAALVPAAARGRARVIARAAGVMAGGPVAQAVWQELDPALRCDLGVAEGARARPGQVVLGVAGSLRSILTGERTTLNFLQRLIGIATLTAQFVAKVKPWGVAILDTRKTTPAWRRLEKYAVTCGGGINHRLGLDDQILIKDNHRAIWARTGGGDLAAAVARARQYHPGLPVEVEVENEDDLRRVLPAKPDWILLDNMTPDRLRRCVQICAGRCRLEASGGITLATVAAVAAAGVDAISLGCLTHSAPAADLTLEVESSG